jgi:hypothetical protein
MREEDLLPEERERGLRQRKMLTKSVNKFLSDYFGFLIAGVVFLILAAGFFMLIKPKYDQTVQVIGVINKQEETDFENKKRELQKIKDLLKSYNDIDQNYKNKISSIIPIRENKEEIFSEVNYLVSRNGLILESVNLGEGGGYDISDSLPGGGEDYLASGEVKRISINLRVRGTDYEAYKNFLSAMENNLPILDVVNLSFDPGNKVSNFLIMTYYIQADIPKEQ